MSDKIIKPEYVFEVSWEVCNKVGGIYTVISTKALSMIENCRELILIGPDIWHEDKDHPDFEEDNSIFPTWRKKAELEGIRVKTGRWNIPGKPIVFLVDFSNYISEKDKILSQFWEDFKLDSLYGQWDYIEPVLFGYAAGKVIESFVTANLAVHNNIIAQFHEWMTGTGVLYLGKKLPQIATVFTTHATVLGRSIAGNGYKLYKGLKDINGDLIARDFNVTSKQSLEKLSAHHADAFTTVSEITAMECSQLLKKDVDIVTPNGFENNFVPEEEEYFVKRKIARKIFIEVAKILTGAKYEEEPLIFVTSGRYEFYNKGYDLFIDSLGELNKDPELQKEILAYILVPGNNYGPKQALYNNLYNRDGDRHIDNKHLTHNLHDLDLDPIMRRIKENELYNDPEDKVKIIFVPSYLNGNDGIFNYKYYDLLPGVDLTAFVSYYEPWGYTPLESIAFGIPTITTDLAGFGKWMQSMIDKDDRSVTVIERNDENTEDVLFKIIRTVKHFTGLSDEEKRTLSIKAIEASEHALWYNLIDEYLEAYSIALNKIESREDKIAKAPQVRTTIDVVASEAKNPLWRRFEIEAVMPEKLKGLLEISSNLWWTSNFKAHQMFEYMDTPLWEENLHNSVTFLEEISSARLNELERDQTFLELYKSVYSEFTSYMAEGENKKSPKVAYFSMEYGLIDNLKIFSGGLGILAGDYLKAASDSNTDIIGIGLLYKYGYFTQNISSNGDQLEEYIPQDFGKLPITPVRDKDGVQIKVSIYFPGRNVYAKIWKVSVGRVPLYLLDTDTEENQEQDKVITSRLYGGDNECRFKQEMILGIGGIRALKEMNIKPDVYHCNEGHAAFIGLERLRILRTKRNLKFDEALEIIRSSTLFTTHTPVPAGHDLFDEDLMRVYMSHYHERLKISWEEFMKLGRVNPEDKFSMSILAANVSQEINGVSRLHGKVSQEMFANLWNGYFPEENHIGYVTNGVHYKTWTAKEWRLLYEKEFGPGFLEDLSNPEYWEKIRQIDNSIIWAIRQKQREKLLDYVKERVEEDWIIQYENPKNIVSIIENINKDVLTIGFARRFATYKRGDLLLRNTERLSKILNNKDRPVQILFAGKAHPNDEAGQKIIKKIVAMAKKPEFFGKIVFIEDYDMALAEKLVQGVDVWLNTPTRPMEASGTSGMKAVMNGALHFSVLDGWWVEGYRKNAGWALPQAETYNNEELQNELDSQIIYNIIENQIAPLFYKRDENGIPNDWVQYIKNSISEIAPNFTAKRMIDDYKGKYYNKLYKRSEMLKKDGYKLVIELAEWKRNMKKAWKEIEIVSAIFPDYEKNSTNLTEEFYGEVRIRLNDILKPEDIGIDVLVSDHSENNKVVITEKYKAEFVRTEEDVALFVVKGCPERSGFYNYAIRIYATNNLLQYPEDSELVMWI